MWSLSTSLVQLCRPLLIILNWNAFVQEVPEYPGALSTICFLSAEYPGALSTICFLSAEYPGALSTICFLSAELLDCTWNYQMRNFSMRLHQQCCSLNLLCKTARVVETATWKIVCSVRRCPFRRGSSLGSCGQTQWLSHQQRKSSVCHTQTGTTTATVGVHKSDSYAELTSSGYHSAHADHVTPCGWQTGKGVPVFWNFILYQILRGWGVISKALPQKSVALSKDFLFFVGVFHCLTASLYSREQKDISLPLLS